MKKWILSRHDSQALIQRISSELDVQLGLSRSSQAVCTEPSEGIIFVNLDDKFIFIQQSDLFFPFLGSQETISLFPSAIVDEGAVKYLLNGADVMRPGIKSYDEWGDVGRIVIVREEKKNRGIVAGKSLVRSDEMASMTKGACIKNIHYIGDKYWNLYKEV